MKGIIKTILILLVVLVVWQVSSELFVIKNDIIPTPYQIILSVLKNFSSKEYFIHISSSLFRVISGFIIALIAAIITAYILYYIKLLNSISNLFEILRPIPPIAWIPFAILIFGLGDMSSIFIVFIGAFFPIFTSMLFGLSMLDTTYAGVINNFEIQGRKLFFDVHFKGSLLYLFNGLKIGFGMAWMSLIASELIGAQSGLGYFIQYNRLLLRTDDIICGMLTIGLIGLCLGKILGSVEGYVVRWK